VAERSPTKAIGSRPSPPSCRACASTGLDWIAQSIGGLECLNSSSSWRVTRFASLPSSDRGFVFLGLRSLKALRASSLAVCPSALTTIEIARQRRVGGTMAIDTTLVSAAADALSSADQLGGDESFWHARQNIYRVRQRGPVGLQSLLSRHARRFRQRYEDILGTFLFSGALNQLHINRPPRPIWLWH
jgi:hypothetical protein